MWPPYAGMLVPVRPEGWPPLTEQVAQNAPEYSMRYYPILKHNHKLVYDLDPVPMALGPFFHDILAR